MRLLIVLSCASFAVGCQSESDTPEAFSSTATVVESVAPGWATEVFLDPLPALELGRRDGAGPTGFASLGTVRFLDDGKIVAGDNQAGRLQVFDSLGFHIATLGQPGDGPGEFRGLGRTYPFPGDSVAAFDFGLSRTLIFDPNSGGSRMVSGFFDQDRAAVSGVLKSGSLISYQALPPSPYLGGEGWDSLRVILVPTDGRPPQEVARVALLEARPTPQAESRVLAPRGLITTSGSGFYAMRSDRYEIIKFDTLGVPRLIIRRDVAPERLNAKLTREYSEGTLEKVSSDAREIYQKRLAGAEFAETIPLFGSAFVDHQERLWVSETPWPSRFVPPRAWSVFSPEGRWLGDVRTPEGFTLQDVRGDLALGYWTDELGVPFIRVHRISLP